MILFKKAVAAKADFEQKFWSGMDLTLLYRQTSAEPNVYSGLELLFKAGYKEFTRLHQQGNGDPDAIMEGTQRGRFNEPLYWTFWNGVGNYELV